MEFIYLHVLDLLSSRGLGVVASADLSAALFAHSMRSTEQQLQLLKEHLRFPWALFMRFKFGIYCMCDLIISIEVYILIFLINID